jgi:hypothetical protein
MTWCLVKHRDDFTFSSALCKFIKFLEPILYLCYRKPKFLSYCCIYPKRLSHVPKVVQNCTEIAVLTFRNDLYNVSHIIVAKHFKAAFQIRYKLP